MRALFRISWAVKFSYTGALLLIIPRVYGEMHANWQIGLELFVYLGYCLSGVCKKKKKKKKPNNNNLKLKMKYEMLFNETFLKKLVYVKDKVHGFFF